MNTIGLTCYICFKDDISTIQNLRQHLSLSLSVRFGRRGGFRNFMCINGTCNVHFSVFCSFVRHIKKFHTNLIQMEQEAPLIQQANNSQYLIEETPIIINSPAENMTAGKFVHFLKSRKTLTATNIEYMIGGIGKLLKHINIDVDRKIQEFLKNNQNDIPNNVIKHFLNDINFTNIFETLQTPYQHLHFVKMNSAYYVEPKEMILGYRIENKYVSNVMKRMSIADTYQYIPIIDTLTVIFKNPSLYALLNSETLNKSPTELMSFLDGNLYKKNSFFIENPHALRLHLYYDDLEVVNPLGSKTSIHKIGAFYVSLQNLPSYLRSNLKFIYPIIICYTEDIKKYGFTKILQPFMRELNILENIGICLGFEKKNYFGTLTSICADSLAYHEMCGFLSPACNKLCRSCYISRTELHQNDRNLVHKQEMKI